MCFAQDRVTPRALLSLAVWKQAFPCSSATAGRGDSLQRLPVLVWALNSPPVHPGLIGLCPFFAKETFGNPSPILFFFIPDHLNSSRS